MLLDTSQSISDAGKVLYSDCLIVHSKYEIKSCDEKPVAGLAAELAERQRQRYAERAERHRKSAELAERREYERLRAKFDSLQGDPD
jgi:hypothetical protein